MWIFTKYTNREQVLQKSVSHLHVSYNHQIAIDLCT